MRQEKKKKPVQILLLYTYVQLLKLLLNTPLSYELFEPKCFHF